SRVGGKCGKLGFTGYKPKRKIRAKTLKKATVSRKVRRIFEKKVQIFENDCAKSNGAPVKIILACFFNYFAI
ncbi:MAG: hypothetical protein IJP68_11655, partial [Selenomonadaceae bacterium]|nr:hypothetical protein [Selenomonadaceae bacterium]